MQRLQRFYFSTINSGGHLVYRSRTILKFLAGNRLGNIPVKSESYWPKVQEGLAFKANC